MVKGVKKIKLAKGSYRKGTYTNKSITLFADSPAEFNVGEWMPGTTEKDVAKGITWIWQDNSRKEIINQFSTGSYGNAKVTISKKQAGSYFFYLEASLGGKRDDSLVGLYINAYAAPIITTSKWSVSNDGTDVRKSRVFQYGEIIHLNLETEGLNGSILVVEIYNIQTARADKKIYTFTNVIVTEGEVNLEIKNTSQWQGLVNNIQDEEKFYVKVKIQGTENYIVDGNKDTAHARFLRIKNKLVANNPKPPTNQTPLKVGQPNVKATKYEPCKFDQINITETQKKDGKVEQKKTLVFDQGKGLVEKKGSTNNVNHSIYFEFDSAVIDKQSNDDLNDILKFLLEHQNSTINLTGYACVIGKQNHNNVLSQKRADEIKKFFYNGGLKSDRIIAVGKGEVNATDDKKGADNLKYKNEKNYQNNRRVDISFTYEGHSAQTIIYETIAPSSPKDVLIDVLGHDNKACYAKPKHTKKIVAKSSFLTGGKLEKSGSSMQLPVKSTLEAWNPAPLQYIWPKYNVLALKDSASLYNIYVNTCRYYSSADNAVIAVRAYPDIKWTLKFFINLTNDLSVKWQNQPEHKIKELQKKAGKIGAERRWEQKDASFGFSLKSEWDKNENGTFVRNKELKAEYETKFKKLYSLFSSIGAMSDGITNKTKGQIRNVGFKGLPMTFAIKPPKLDMKAVWLLENAKRKNSDSQLVGTKVDISFNADPLIGLEITIDLLCSAVGLVAGAVSGGTAAPGAVRLYNIIKGKLNTGISIGNDDLGAKVSSDVYIDLIISSVIKTTIGFSFNTVSDNNDKKAKLELTNTLKLELKAGIWVKAEVNLIVVKSEAYFEISGKGSASITFGHGVNYDDKGLFYKPQLGFDGLNAEYVIKGKVGLSSKKKVLGGTKPKSEDEGIISEGKYNEVVPKFDVIKSLEELFGFDANIPLIRN